MVNMQSQAIARAVYSKKDILIFDDVMSGLDAATASKVFDRVLGNRGLLFAAKRTRILVTHARETSDIQMYAFPGTTS